MKEDDRKQILALIKTLEQQKGYVPYLEDFVNHPTYGALFSSFSQKEKNNITDLITTYISDQISSLRTK